MNEFLTDERFTTFSFSLMFIIHMQCDLKENPNFKNSGNYKVILIIIIIENNGHYLNSGDNEFSSNLAEKKTKRFEIMTVSCFAVLLRLSPHKCQLFRKMRQRTDSVTISKNSYRRIVHLMYNYRILHFNGQFNGRHSIAHFIAVHSQCSI